MSSTNQSPEFLSAQKRYYGAQTDEEKLIALEEMSKYMPKHKAGESLRANIRTRIKKLKEKIEDKKQQRKSVRKEGIKKEGIQVVLIGLTQSGKSSLLSSITNAQPLISNHQYTTKTETIGTLHYQDISFQIIDTPAINYETFDQGLANSADILLIIITNLKEIEEILLFLEKAQARKIIVFNKSDLLIQEEKRKILAYLQSKKHNFVLISTKTRENIEELKDKLIENSGVIRVYTKQPGKPQDKEPVIMQPESTVQEVAEKIFHKKAKIKKIFVTGPSSKFPNQQVSLSHQLKDKDILEFYVE